MTPAIFLDKDGTLLRDVPYNTELDKMVFAPGVRHGLPHLSGLGLPLIVITNQPGLALGKFDYEALARMRRQLHRMCEEAGAPLAGFYFCPHAPVQEPQDGELPCECRKPRPGLLLTAAKDHDIDLQRSWFIGDILDDVEAGRRAGCRTVLINNGNETQWRLNALRTPDRIVADFAGASQFLFHQVHADEVLP